jgi:hypothetical protein
LGNLSKVVLHIDDKKGCLSPGGAGHHILQEFDMAGSVHDEIVTLSRLEENPGRINRDPLGLFILQGIDQKGIFKGF